MGMVHLETESLAGTQASVIFNPISADYDDLLLIVNAKSSRTNSPRDNLMMTFNGVGGTSYGNQWLEGTGSAAYSSAQANTSSIQVTWALSADFGSTTAGIYGSTKIYITSYRNSLNKSIISDQTAIRNSTDSHSAIQGSLASITAPITSISLSPENGSFLVYSSFSLYGIKKGSDGVTTVS